MENGPGSLGKKNYPFDICMSVPYADILLFLNGKSMRYGLCSGLLLSLFCFSLQGAPILAHYPDCDYRVVNHLTASGKVSMVAPDADIAKILRQLQQQASVEPDGALLLTGLTRKVIKKRHSEKNTHTQFNYQAQLISGCENWLKHSDRITPFNQQGKPQTALQQNRKSRMSIEVKIASHTNKERERTPPASSEVSLTSGVYGIRPGISLAEFIRKMGPEDVRIQSSDGLTLGYGRRHWYYFSEQTLVSAEYGSTMVDQEMINAIVPQPFFDPPQWQINGQFGPRTQWSALQINGELPGLNTHIREWRDHEHRMQLQFDTFTESNGQKNKRLTGFRFGNLADHPTHRTIPPVTAKVSALRESEINIQEV